MLLLWLSSVRLIGHSKLTWWQKQKYSIYGEKISSLKMIYLADEYVSSTIILRISILICAQCVLFYLWWKDLRYTPLTRIWNVAMVYLVKGSGKKADRCQSYTNFFPEGLTNVCGARELREIWSLLKLFSLGKWALIKIHYERCLRGGGLKKFQISLSSLAAHR